MVTMIFKLLFMILIAQMVEFAYIANGLHNLRLTYPSSVLYGHVAHSNISMRNL